MGNDRIMENYLNWNLSFEYHRYLKLFFSGVSILCVAIISLIIVSLGVHGGQYNLALLGVLLFWVYGLAYGFAYLKYRFNYAIMMFMLFVFLLSRPAISMFYGDVWWYFSDSTIEKAIWSLFVCEVALTIGTALVPTAIGTEKLGTVTFNVINRNTVAASLLILVAVTGVVNLYTQAFTYMQMRNLGYEAMYTSEMATVVLPIYIVSAIFPFAVYAYLATFPPKKHAIPVLLLYIIAGVPIFLLGNRASLILRIAFVTVYFFIRDIIQPGSKKWITKPLKAFFIAIVFASVFILGLFNYTRADQVVSTEKNMPVAVDFFYKQGTSFDTLCEGYEYERQIRALPEATSYTMGNLIDRLVQGRIGRMVTDEEEFGSGNNIRIVEHGNNMAHRLSYVYFGEDVYLQGHGRGSSFLLENYYDGGYLLIGIFSFVLGLFLSYSVNLMMRGSFLINYFIISALSQFFILPRAGASSFLIFLGEPLFWMVLLFIVVAVFLTNHRIIPVRYPQRKVRTGE